MPLVSWLRTRGAPAAAADRAAPATTPLVLGFLVVGPSGGCPSGSTALDSVASDLAALERDPPRALGPLALDLRASGATAFNLAALDPASGPSKTALGLLALDPIALDFSAFGESAERLSP
jgi:hypothetical protein